MEIKSIFLKDSALLMYAIITMDMVTSSLFYETCAPPPSTDQKGAMMVLFCDNPMWKTHYIDRVFPTITGYIVEPNRDFVHELEVEPGNSSIWHSISKRTSILCFQGLYDYDDTSIIGAIEEGKVGETCPKLRYFKTENLNLKNLTKNTFKYLDDLAILALRNNSIKYLPIDVFEYLRNIIWINLDGTAIQTISHQHFCICTNLQFLQIRSSNLTNINDIADVQYPEQRCSFKLLSFTLDSNIFLNMTSELFKHYSMHGVLSIANTSLSELKQDYFIGLENVLFLSLENNKIKIIPQDVFNATSKSLQGIRLSSNFITEIDIEKSFRNLSLISLFLESNKIQNVSGTFRIFPDIFEIHLNDNKIRKLPQDAFTNLTNLQILDLGNNKLNSVPSSLFSGLTSLKRLNMSDNNIETLPEGIFQDLNTVATLSMTNNLFKHLDPNLFSNCIKLENLEVSGNQLTDMKYIIVNSAHIRNVDLSHNFLKDIPKLLYYAEGMCRNNISARLQTLNASFNKISHFPADCFRNLTVLDLQHNLLTDMLDFNGMETLQTLNLRQNLIERIEDVVINPYKISLKSLDLGQNLIHFIGQGVFQSPLEYLYLDGNSLKYLDPLNMPYFNYISISGNPLSCGCNNLDLIVWLNNLKPQNHDNVTCVGSSDIRDFDVQKCSDAVVVALCVSISVSFVMLTGIVVCRYRYELQVIAFYKWHVRFRLPLSSTKSSKRQTYTYDAFVCFAEEDVDYVRTTIVPLLEPQYKLCIYYRDFPVGEDIAEAILNVIEKSAVTIIVLSEAFLKSRWGRFEFRRAHHHVMMTDNTRMIVILLEDSVLKKKLDLTLRSILYTKAYLKKNDALFNEKLLFAVSETKQLSQPLNYISPTDNTPLLD
ncbi:protein toll-like [Mya arenaria]|uniref:protein toll-like n=1 Tax=Mya arenaria TaxID=6604 RepID=UPI0022E81617|nr:protein toll-like [Mya arenaria]